MSIYLEQIFQAAMIFPFVALIFTIPTIILQYRRFGHLHFLRLLIVFSFYLYILNLAFLVMLPLPTTLHNCPDGAVSGALYQLEPFRFFTDIAKEAHFHPQVPESYLRIFKASSFYQVAFNILLFLPLGVYFRYYFIQRFIPTALFSLGLSLFIEITQGTGVYGLFACPYRVLDVDDLFANTLGGILGFIAAPLFTFFLPERKRLLRYQAADRVSAVRRVIAWGVDYVILQLIWSFYLETLSYSKPVLLFILLILYFGVLPYLWKGFTFGKWLLRFRIEDINGRRHFFRFLHRGTWPSLLLTLDVAYFQWVNSVSIVSRVDAFIFLAILCLHAAFFLLVIFRITRADTRLFYEKWSRTKKRPL
ncbi:VanZ family protein [Bacillaceae bacterium SIJ1]|uniref:VanZ family protein n=1 Tax=Litoribacterium kuwaitense TaxID=1398745 RepID=UPI0013EC528B|nr:VanZ family protein [Litoribacterium kuwaitense]NGP46594.1 VanZ family protein [Litoribacterium kuwaitense]